MEDFTVKTFEKHLKETFTVTEGGDSYELKLIEVTSGELKHHEEDEKPDHREPFSLIFETDPATPLSQDLHTLVHEKLGELELLLTPIEIGDDKKIEYEVVFG